MEIGIKHFCRTRTCRVCCSTFSIYNHNNTKNVEIGIKHFCRTRTCRVCCSTFSIYNHNNTKNVEIGIKHFCRTWTCLDYCSTFPTSSSVTPYSTRPARCSAQEPQRAFISLTIYICTREPVWPSGKALGWQAEGPRFDTASALLSLRKGCGLWTLSCDFVHHFLLKH